MKKIYLSIWFCFLFYSLAAQNGRWTWVSGDNTSNVPGVYGVKGEPNKENKPGSRSGSVSWKDDADNLWLFGGYGYDANFKLGFLNDLWLYNTSDREWTWVSGDNTVNRQGEYGTSGTPAQFNQPGSRSGSVSWIDAAGKLWLFGGYGRSRADVDNSEWQGDLNDLWQ